MRTNKKIYFVNVTHGRAGGALFEKRDFSMRGAYRPFEISLLHYDGLARIGLKIESPTGRDLQVSLGYFRRF